MTIISEFILILLCVPLFYLILLAVSSIHTRIYHDLKMRKPSHRFLITIPAHNEEAVIENTIKHLFELDYPENLYNIHIVADHCSDNTVSLSRQYGVTVHERNDDQKGGKGAALTWLFKKVLNEDKWDAVVIFDADTQVDRNFLRIMDIRLSKGEKVIQGQHIISNPDQGLFPALTWAMFMVDNRFQNLGRTNLGWSAKNMGDSICFRIDILKRIGWGQGLTEDYQLRLKLLLNGIRIAYEPEAIGYGEAPRTWTEAKVQRRRWLRGTFDSSRFSLFNMFHTGINRRDIPLLEGAVQALLPSYSTLTLLCMLMLIIQGLTNLLVGPVFSLSIIVAWISFLVVLLSYPMFGLVLTHAPIKAYLAILSGPFFIIWRTWLALKVRFGGEEVMWDRTPHGVRKISDS